MHDHLLAQHAALKTLRKSNRDSVRNSRHSQRSLKALPTCWPSPRPLRLRKAAQQIAAFSERRVAKLVRECHRPLGACRGQLTGDRAGHHRRNRNARRGRIRRPFRGARAAVSRRSRTQCSTRHKPTRRAPPPSRWLRCRPSPSRHDGNSSAASTARWRYGGAGTPAPADAQAAARARRVAMGRGEADLLHLLSSWFNPGFLEMRRVDWSSPAHLLEQIIRHEAVHAIDGWGRPAPAPGNPTAAASRSFIRNWRKRC